MKRQGAIFTGSLLCIHSLFCMDGLSLKKLYPVRAEEYGKKVGVISKELEVYLQERINNARLALQDGPIRVNEGELTLVDEQFLQIPESSPIITASVDIFFRMVLENIWKQIEQEKSLAYDTVVKKRELVLKESARFAEAILSLE